MAVTNAFSSFIRAFWERIPRKYLWLLPADALAIVCACIIIPLWSASGVSVEQARAHGLYGVVWLALGMLVFVVRPREFSSLLFNLMGIGLLLQELDLSHTALSQSGFAQFIVPLYILLNSAVVLHFLLVFPKVRAWRWKVLAPFYLLFGIVCIATEILIASHISLDATGFPEILSRVRSYLYPAMNLAGVALVLYSYFSSRDPAERRRLRWTFFGGGIALVWQAVTVNIPRLLGTDMQIDPILAEAGLFAAPIGIAIGLIWFNTFEIDRFLSQTLAYATVLVLLVLVYEALGYVFTQILGHTLSGATSVIGSIITTSIIAISFEPVKDWVQSFIDDRFFSEAINADDAISEIEKAARKHGAAVTTRECDGFSEIVVKISHKP